MDIIEVNNKTRIKQFHNFPKELYKNDPNWVCPLDVEIEGIFTPHKNICFQHGEAIRFLLSDRKGKIIGRIAAFYDKRKSTLFDYPAGGAGFFECINDQQAANMLFDAAKIWLKSKGMEAMQAPINFGENYNYWGCLVEGFMRQSYAMPYNFPYYRQLFENYGFKNFFEQNSFHKNLKEPWAEHMIKFAEYTQSRPGYFFEHFSFRNIEKYVGDFVYTYNAIWSKFHDGYTPLQNSDIRKLLEEAKIAIDEELIWFAYDKGKPAGLLVAFPDINQILAKLKNGKLNLLNKLKFVYYRKRIVTRSRTFIVGVLPDYQNTGIIAALYYQLIKVLNNRPEHVETEISWVGDYNPKMLSLYNKMRTTLAKKHITYMHLFDPAAEFRRFDNNFKGKLYRGTEDGKKN